MMANHSIDCQCQWQWLYVLADGSIGYLDSNNRFVGSVAPDADNPMVSRVAFWTDDESCKVKCQHRVGRGVLGHAKSEHNGRPRVCKNSTPRRENINATRDIQR